MIKAMTALMHNGLTRRKYPMKKVLSLILILSLLASAAVIVPAAAEGEELYYVYTANGKPLNMRVEPNKSARLIVKIPYGDEFWVYETLGSGWTYGRWANQDGYVMTRFLTKDKPAPKTPSRKDETPEEYERRKEEEKLTEELRGEKDVSPFTIAVVATRATGWINFRYGPSKITARIASYPDGKELTVQGETDRWYKALDPDTGRIGYINKKFTTVLTKASSEEEKQPETKTPEEQHDLGKLDINGEFDLTCKLPEGYKLQVLSSRGDKIIASIQSEDMTAPQMYLSIAYDETYGEVERMNNMTDEDLAVLEDTFKELNQVEITYLETGHGTKVMVARETGTDTDFIDILAIYKGYFVEFHMTPNAKAADQRLTEEDLKTCIDFLTDVDFNPVEKAE